MIKLQVQWNNPANTNRIAQLKRKMMASAFWNLEDGRTLARRWTGMVYMLQLITGEILL